MDLTTNGVVITDAIKFVQSNKDKLTMSSKEDNNSKESKEPDYDDRQRTARRKTRRGNRRNRPERNNKSSLLKSSIKYPNSILL